MTTESRRYATPDMTDLQLLELIREGLIAQEGPSVDEDQTCRYRGPGGRRCAAGLLIRDEHYDPSLEEKALRNHEQVWKALVASGVPDRRTARDAVERAQVVHDRFGHAPGTASGTELAWDRIGPQMDRLTALCDNFGDFRPSLLRDR